MFFIMRWHGQRLITPLSNRGIIDLEFARTEERFYQLRLFWQREDVVENIYLDFLFIASAVWLLVSVSLFIKEKTGWEKWTNAITGISFSAGFFDVAENFLMLLVLNGRFNFSVLQIIYYVAAIKFILFALAIILILCSLPGILRKRNSSL